MEIGTAAVVIGLFGFAMFRWVPWLRKREQAALIRFAKFWRLNSKYAPSEWKDWKREDVYVGVNDEAFFGFQGEFEGRRFSYSLAQHVRSKRSDAFLRGFFSMPTGWPSFQLTRGSTFDADAVSLSNRWKRAYGERPLSEREESALRAIADQAPVPETLFFDVAIRSDEYSVQPPGFLSEVEVPPEWANQRLFTVSTRLIPGYLTTDPASTHELMSLVEAHIERSIRAWQILNSIKDVP